MADWLTLKDVRDLLGVAPNTVRKLIRTGKLPAYQITGIRGPRFKREDVEALIRPIEVKSAESKGKKKKG
jgi:excisionase family DNA binding protein